MRHREVGFSGSGGRRIDDVIGDHRVENGRGARRSRLRMAQRIEIRWGLDQPGQERRLRQVERPRRLIEIELGRRRHADRAFAQIDVVQIAVEDLVLAQMQFQPNRHQRLAQFEDVAPVVSEIVELDKLLGDRAGALDDFSRQPVCLRRAENAAQIDSGVVKETAILDAEHRVDQHRRIRFERNVVDAQRPDAPERLAICRLEQQRRLGCRGHRPADRHANQRPQQRAGRDQDKGDAGKRRQPQKPAQAASGDPRPRRARQRPACRSCGCRGSSPPASEQHRQAMSETFDRADRRDCRGCHIGAERFAEFRYRRCRASARRLPRRGCRLATKAVIRPRVARHLHQKGPRLRVGARATQPDRSTDWPQRWFRHLRRAACNMPSLREEQTGPHSCAKNGGLWLNSP
jgi:hypothetical protein